MAVTPAKYTTTSTVLAVQLTAGNVADAVAWLVSLGVRAWASARGAVAVGFMSGPGAVTAVTAVPGDWVTFSTTAGAGKVSAAVFAASYVKAKS